MTGLRERLRDPDLPARAGQPELAPLDASAVRDLLVQHLLAADGSPPSEVQWNFARWKPGTSLSTGYRVVFPQGEDAILHVKRYASGKARHLAKAAEQVQRRVSDELREAATGPWRRYVHTDAEARLALWAFPADRELPGLPRLFEMHRTKRLCAALGLFGEARIRSHRSRAVVLRYKPERRAVLRLDLVLAEPGGGRRPTKVAARVLPPDHARRVEAAREACYGVPGLVPLLGCEPRTGLLLEAWCEGQAYQPDVFGHAFLAGRSLAGLHRAAPPAEPAPAPAALSGLAPLLAWEPSLARRLADVLDPPRPARSTWVHGDFHPDQILVEPDGAPRLMDLDNLGPGDPLDDLSSWVADHLTEQPGCSLPDAAGPLLEGYAEGGGQPPHPDALRGPVAVELVRRAAAAPRRLEQDAVQRAADLLDRARELAPAGAVFGR